MAEDNSTDQSQLIRRGLVLAGTYIRSHPVLFTFACIGSVVMAAGTVASTVTLGWLTDDVVLPAFDGTEATRSQSAVIAAVLLVTLARSAGVVMRRYFAGRTVYRCKDDLQIALGKKYLGMPSEEVRSAEKGRMLAHVDSDVEVATDLLSPLPFAIGVLALLVMSVVSLALVDWVLMIVAFAMLPLIALLNQLNALASKGPAVDSRESVGRLSTVAAESFDGATIVKTLGREADELDRFSLEAAELRDHSVRLGRIRAIFSSLLDLLPDIGVVVLVVLGAARVGDGHITTGQLVQAVALFSLLVFPLRVIGYFFGDMPPSVVAHDRIVRVLDRPDRPPYGATGLDQGAIQVQVDAVSVSHGEASALVDVTLEVAPGEVLALVGHTGSGKSTLLSAMADMVALDAGDIRLNGVCLQELSAYALSNRVAVAWQEPFLLPASVAENVAFGGDYGEREIEDALDAAHVADVVEALPDGLNTGVGETGAGLSGGQRQRLVLARALVRKPGLLLLDDATSAVDPVTEEQVLSEVRELGATTVVVAHRRSTIMLADRIVMMGSGRVRAMGTHEEMLEHEAYVSLLEAYDRDVDR